MSVSRKEDMTPKWDVEDFDYVHFVIPDVNGIPRGLVVPKRYVKEKMEEGVDLFYGTLMMGPLTEFKLSVDEFKQGFNHTWRPDLSTLIPTPWSDSGVRRTASVLCDLVTREGTLDELSTRHIVQRLVKRLKEQHGLVLRAGFELEFTVYEKDTGQPLGSDTYRLLDLRMTQPALDLLYELVETLGQADLHVMTVTPEFIPGQWELNFQPREGIEAADLAFHVKNAVKIFFRRKGYEATFMSYPERQGDTGNGLHFNMSLWADDTYIQTDQLASAFQSMPFQDKSVKSSSSTHLTPLRCPAENAVGPNGQKSGKGCNCMRDDTELDGLSAVAWRWNAGILAHARAMAAVCCPTTNCYRRFHRFGAPSKAKWGIETRSGLTRFKTTRGNIHLESRLPSAAANPYLVLAAYLVAGMHGLQAEMTSPPPLDTEHAQTLPHTLEEALKALEEDTVMRDGLGHRFVAPYLTVKRDYEVNEYKQKAFTSDEEQFEYESKKYFTSL